MSVSGRVLGLYLAEPEELVKPWLAHELVEPFPYWINTDRPDGVSSEAWAERREPWRAALEMDDGPGVPARIGVTAECVSLHQPPPLGEDLAEEIPDRETRVRIRARYRVMQERFEELADAADEDDPSAFRLTPAAARWLETAEGRTVLEIEIATADEVLAEELKMNDLTSTVDGPPTKEAS